MGYNLLFIIYKIKHNNINYKRVGTALFEKYFYYIFFKTIYCTLINW